MKKKLIKRKRNLKIVKTGTIGVHVRGDIKWPYELNAFKVQSDSTNNNI